MSTVSGITGITATLLRHESPLSVVFPKLLQWISITTSEAAEHNNTTYHPGIVPYIYV